MTKDEARDFLQACESPGWIGWDEATDSPDWSMDLITLDGNFSREELEAILVFAPAKSDQSPPSGA